MARGPTRRRWHSSAPRSSDRCSRRSSTTVEYVRHRLALAGVDREVFTSDALALLHEGSAGRLRDIDRLATTSLKHAARDQHNLVDRGIVVNVANSHQR